MRAVLRCVANRDDGGEVEVLIKLLSPRALSNEPNGTSPQLFVGVGVFVCGAGVVSMGVFSK